ncbi:MAG: UDP binding domain-containing protein [Negativicutes bacterium]
MFSGYLMFIRLTFKPNTDDLRDAPFLDNISIFVEDNAIIKAYDPVGEKNYRKLYPSQIHYCKTIEEALIGADVCFIFTEWDEIKNFDIAEFGALMKTPIVLDGRNCYRINDLEESNIVYESIGRRTVGRSLRIAPLLRCGTIEHQKGQYSEKVTHRLLKR